MHEVKPFTSHVLLTQLLSELVLCSSPISVSFIRVKELQSGKGGGRGRGGGGGGEEVVVAESPPSIDALPGQEDGDELESGQEDGDELEYIEVCHCPI